MTGLSPARRETILRSGSRSSAGPRSPRPSSFLVWHSEAGADRRVLSVHVPIGPDKPYALVHNRRSTYFIRVGSTCREASREELERMFQASGHLRYGQKPVPGATVADLDVRRLRDYFSRVLQADFPGEVDDEQWQILLCNLELAATSAGHTLATVDGMLLFGRDVKRRLPQSGIRAVCYPGKMPDYAVRADEFLKGPLVPLGAADGSMVESGVVDSARDFVRRNTTPSAYLEGARRIDRWDYPEDVVREAVVNALVHRDYSIAGTDVMLSIFSDRLEVQSPGSPNTVTVDGMKYTRATRRWSTYGCRRPRHGRAEPSRACACTTAPSRTWSRRRAASRCGSGRSPHPEP